MTTPTPETERRALNALRHHHAEMTRPDFNEIADATGLTAKTVETMWEKLLAGRDPIPTPTPAYRAPGRRVQPPTSTPTGWRAAANHPNPKVRKAVAKAIAAVAAAEKLIADDAGKAELRAREAKLAAELAKVRAELRGTTTTPSGCACGKTFTSAQGRALHRTRTGCTP